MRRRALSVSREKIAENTLPEPCDMRRTQKEKFAEYAGAGILTSFPFAALSKG